MRVEQTIVSYSIAIFAADECELLSLGVHPQHRRKHFASRLSKDLISEARARNARVIFLEVRNSNDAARAFYSVMGYEVVAKRTRYYQDGEDALILRLALDDQRGSERDG